MGLFSRLFGRNKSAPVKHIEPIEYKGFLIYPDSMPEGGQYRIAGKITKQFEDKIQSHRFIRSDLISNEAEANQLMVRKSQMFIDQMGDKIFG